MVLLVADDYHTHFVKGVALIEEGGDKERQQTTKRPYTAILLV